MAGMMSEEERQRILAMMMAGQPFRRPPPVQATPATPLPGVPMNVGVVAHAKETML